MTNNPYALPYKKVAEVTEPKGAGHTVDLRFVDNFSMNKRRFNKPTSNNITGVFSSVEGLSPTYRHIVCLLYTSRCV